MDPDLINELDMAADVDTMIAKWSSSKEFPRPDDYDNETESSTDEEDSDQRKPFDIKKLRGRPTEPMKTKTMKSRDVKNLQPSEGFLKAIQRNQSKFSG